MIYLTSVRTVFWVDLLYRETNIEPYLAVFFLKFKTKTTNYHVKLRFGLEEGLGSLSS